MPSFRKLSPAEIAALDQPPIGARAEIARAYDESLADFAAGDYGRAELVDGERRTLVRRRLQAAACHCSPYTDPRASANMRQAPSAK